MSFSASFAEIDALLAQTEEYVRIRMEEDAFPAGYFHDMRPVLHRIRLEGSWIDQSALFELCRSLQTINGIIAFLRRDVEHPQYPRLRELTGDIATYPEITRKIDTILDGFGQVKDYASARLSEIRRELSSAASGISRSLNSILRKAQA